MRNLIILEGQEGAGKSTIIKAILPELTNGAAFDAENILQVNPFEYNLDFQKLAIQNSVSLIENFFTAGYRTVVAASFIGDIKQYDRFRKAFKKKTNIYIVMLVAPKSTRDQRRLKRKKPTTKYWRNRLDKLFPQDTSLKDAKRDYKYIEIDNGRLSINETVKAIKKALPGVFRK